MLWVKEGTGMKQAVLNLNSLEVELQTDLYAFCLVLQMCMYAAKG